MQAMDLAIKQMLEPRITEEVEDSVKQHLIKEKRKLTPHNVVMIAMAAVESFSARSALPGEGKLQAAKDLVPAVLQKAQELGAISAQDAAVMENRFQSGIDDVEDMVNLLIDISKNPHFIQTVENVKACCSELQAKRERKRARK